MYIDAAYCYRRSSVVCLSVCHYREPCKNGWTDRDAVWVVGSGGTMCNVLDGVSSISCDAKEEFWGELPIVKFSDCLPWSVQKRLNQSRYRLGCGLGWVQGSTCYMGVHIGEYDWTVHVRLRWDFLSNYFDRYCHFPMSSYDRHRWVESVMTTENLEVAVAFWIAAFLSWCIWLCCPYFFGCTFSRVLVMFLMWVGLRIKRRRCTDLCTVFIDQTNICLEPSYRWIVMSAVSDQRLRPECYLSADSIVEWMIVILVSSCTVPLWWLYRNQKP